MARQAGGFRGDAFHQITVTHDPISKVTDHLESQAVVARGEIGLRDGHADPVAVTLTERYRGGFHSGCELTLRMAWRQASLLADLFGLIEGRALQSAGNAPVPRSGLQTELLQRMPGKKCERRAKHQRRR